MSVARRPASRPTRARPHAGRERLVLAVLLTASFTLAVDFSILNVALPADRRRRRLLARAPAVDRDRVRALRRRLHAAVRADRRPVRPPPAVPGRDRAARRRPRSPAGSRPSPRVLLAARAAQGLATAIVTPAALSLLTTAFPEGPSRERALGLNGALMAAGFTTGAILGGVLTDLLSWRWAFFINVAVAAAVLAVAPAVLRESRPERRPRLDVPGALAVTVGAARHRVRADVGRRAVLDRAGHARARCSPAPSLLLAFWAIERACGRAARPAARAGPPHRRRGATSPGCSRSRPRRRSCSCSRSTCSRCSASRRWLAGHVVRGPRRRHRARRHRSARA